ncbi:MAG: Tm-1-like ATP-binding domain-containing protein [Planctomycetes bacterium]|nr:Tm-1-like ATP-binding domain-containing protein [Planctomycetota bacterium]
MPVVLVGTFDTKGTEFQFVRDVLHGLGLATLAVDAGVNPPVGIQPEISRELVFAAADTQFDTILARHDRGEAVEAAARGAAQVISELYHAGKLEGVLGLGGSAGTTIGTAAMRALPFGVPKLMVSTLASGQVRQFVGVRDILMLHSVVDISGLNRISRIVLENAARAIAGMVRFQDSTSRVGQSAVGAESSACAEHPLIAATMFGVTTPCVDAARRQLEGTGAEVLVFHATGTGGMTMESFIADGLIHGVLDLTTTELADELVGGILSAGPERLTAAGRRGIPQVISVGAVDMVNFGPRDTVPAKFADRLFYQHNANVTLMRTTPAENLEIGREIARKANAATGPTVVLLPLRGVSAIDAEGGPFWWPAADEALFAGIRETLNPRVRLLELDRHINDPEIATAAATTLRGLIADVSAAGSKS